MKKKKKMNSKEQKLRKLIRKELKTQLNEDKKTLKILKADLKNLIKC